MTPLATLLAEHYIAVVHKDSPMRTGKDIVEVLRQRPDSLAIAVGNLRVVAVSGPKRLGGLFAAAPTWSELGYENARRKEE